MSKTSSWFGQRSARMTGVLLTCLLAFLASFKSLHNPWFERLELLYYDWRFTTVPLQPISTALPEITEHPIVIVDVDEASLSAIGQWPWRRSVVARMVSQLTDQGAAVVGFDVVFAEPELGIRQWLHDQANNNAALQPLLEAAIAHGHIIDGDQQLAQALQQTDTVLGMFFQSDSDLKSGQLLSPVASLAPERQSGYIHMPGYTSAIPALMSAATMGGFVSTFGDADGIIRRSPLVIRYQDALYPSLSLSMVMAYLLDSGLQRDEVTVGDWWVPRELGLKGRMARTDAQGQVLVPFLGGQGSFPYVSAADVLAGKVEDDQLEGALVLIGTSAQGLSDLRSTPVGARYPGVEVHANIIHALLEGRFPYRPEWASGATFVLMMGVGLVLSWLLPGASPLRVVVASLSVVTLVLLGNWWLWHTQYLDLPLSGMLMLVMVLVVLNLAYSFVTENHTRRRLKGIFDQYVPPAHIEQMMEEPDAYHLHGENRELTVLFSDICSFTSISENLSAVELTQLLNHYFTPVTRTIFDHDGTIDKYVGDLVMAFWGAPVTDAEHANKAVAAALALTEVTRSLAPEFQQRGWPVIDAGIGLNSGEMNVGDMGSAYRRAYTVLGDAVNLGSRLEGLTRFYGVPVLVGERTRELADEFEYQYIDRIQVKGKEKPVDVYAPLGRLGSLDAAKAEELQVYQQALEQYFAQRWQEADKTFSDLQQRYPRVRVYQVYQARVQHWLQHPPEQWDGSFRHTSK